MIRTVDEDLRDPGLARLLTSARERFEALGGARGRVTLHALGADEAAAIDAIWKRSAPAIFGASASRPALAFSNSPMNCLMRPAASFFGRQP